MVEIYSYITIEIFLLFNIIVRYNNNIKSLLTFLILIFHILIVRTSGFDGDISVYMDGFHQDRSEIYYLKEILFWLILDFYGYLLDDSFVFLILDYSVLILIFAICKKVKIRYYYAPMFFVTFFNILGHQNIYRQWLASMIFIYFFANRSKFIYFIPAVHNALAAFVGAIFLKSSKYSIFALLLLPLTVYVVSLYLPPDYQEVHTGASFVLPLNLFMVMNFIILKSLSSDDRVVKFFLYTALMVAASSIFLSSAFAERMVYLYLSLIMPFTLFELNKKSKMLTLGYCFILIVPSYFTSVMLFLN